MGLFSLSVRSTVIVSVLALTLGSGLLRAEPRSRFDATPGIRNDAQFRPPANRRPSSDVSESGNPDASSYWNPEAYTYYVGYEGSGVPSILPQNSVVLGQWFDSRFGGEIFVGYSNPADSFATSVQTSADAVANSQNTLTTNSGTRSAATLLIGVAPKLRFVQSSWVQLYLAGVLGFVFGNSTNYATGSRQVSVADLTDPTTFSVNETNFGTIQIERSAMFLIGPKLGSEFYLKWIPNLALGFSTGFLFTSGGSTKTTTSTKTRSIDTVSGVEQPAAPDSSFENVAETQPGLQATTFGIGGAQFNLFGNFSLRYVW